MLESVNSPAQLELFTMADQPVRDLRMLRDLVKRYGKNMTFGQAQEQAAQIVAEVTNEYQEMKRQGKAL